VVVSACRLQQWELDDQNQDTAHGQSACTPSPAEPQGSHPTAFAADVMQPPEPIYPRLSVVFKGFGLVVGKCGTPIVRDVTGRFVHSKMHAVMGPSGSGKTSFCVALAGRVRPSRLRGRVHVVHVDRREGSFKDCRLGAAVGGKGAAGAGDGGATAVSKSAAAASAHAAGEGVFGQTTPKDVSSGHQDQQSRGSHVVSFATLEAGAAGDDGRSHPPLASKVAPGVTSASNPKPNVHVTGLSRSSVESALSSASSEQARAVITLKKTMTQQGEVLLLDDDVGVGVVREMEEVRYITGFVPQDDLLHDTLTVRGCGAGAGA
jgi:energy-coupling factor transporter ATP-binding protein EcfA2